MYVLRVEFDRWSLLYPKNQFIINILISLTHSIQQTDDYLWWQVMLINMHHFQHINHIYQHFCLYWIHRIQIYISTIKFKLPITIKYFINFIYSIFSLNKSKVQACNIWATIHRFQNVLRLMVQDPLTDYTTHRLIKPN